jgi:thiol-disulfide isomerase/thioredoxin
MAKRSTFVWTGVLAAVVLGTLLFLGWSSGTFGGEGFAANPVLSYYFLPTCGWCQKFNPTWEKMQIEAKNQGMSIQFKKINGEEAAAEVEAKGIQGFPTLRLEIHGKDLEYDGERSVEAILAFVKEHSME